MTPVGRSELLLIPPNLRNLLHCSLLCNHHHDDHQDDDDYVDDDEHDDVDNKATAHCAIDHDNDNTSNQDDEKVELGMFKMYYLLSK